MSVASAPAGGVTLRPARPEDATFVADLLTAARPDDPEDPVVLRYRWEHPHDGIAWDRSIAAMDGRAVGMCAEGHPSWELLPRRFARLQAELLPETRTVGALGSLIDVVERRAAAAGAELVSVWAWDDDAVKREAIVSRGFREERRARFWELDLVRNASAIERMTAASRERTRAEGIALLPLSGDVDPDRYEKLWRMSDEAQRDVPTTLPHTERSFDGFMSWLRDPALCEDRIWIARQGDEIVGISVLAYPPVRGVVYTDWTGIARSARGKGLARALKCETLTQAISLGVPTVRTDNDAENRPILHLNETMGYQPCGEMIQHIKQLEDA